MTERAGSAGLGKPGPGQAFTERDGRELAVALFHEIEASDCETAAINAEYRDEGKPQDNTVLRYLAVLREANSRELEAGFAAVLTDFVACCLDGSVPDAAYYERFIEDPA